MTQVVPVGRGAGALRADARHNRVRVLEAAKACFAESGGATGMADIARRAGVGVGTLYRSFGSRPQLMVAVYREAVDDLTRAASRLADGRDPWEALVAWLCTYLEMYEVKRSMLGELRPLFEQHPELVEQSREQSIAALAAVLGPAQAAGAARADLHASDVLQLVNGIVTYRTSGARRDGLLLEVIVQGLRV